MVRSAGLHARLFCSNGGGLLGQHRLCLVLSKSHQRWGQRNVLAAVVQAASGLAGVLVTRPLLGVAIVRSTSTPSRQAAMGWPLACQGVAWIWYPHTQACTSLGAGSIDVKELHVGLLLVYDKLNKAS